MFDMTGLLNFNGMWNFIFSEGCHVDAFVSFENIVFNDNGINFMFFQ